MNDETGILLRSLKDNNGNYIWKDSDNSILGKPVVFTPYMPNATTGNLPIAFGDLSYFWFLQREPLCIKPLIELFAGNGMIGFAAYERFDGKLIRPEAVKTLELKK